MYVRPMIVPCETLEPNHWYNMHSELSGIRQPYRWEIYIANS